MSQYSTLLTELSNGVFIITINREDKLNALNKAVISDLAAAIDEVYNNAEIRGVIITGKGAKSFVAGADISEFKGMDEAGGVALAKRGHEVFNKIEQCPKPIIAAVNGFALGGGCELAMACHLSRLPLCARICRRGAAGAISFFPARSVARQFRHPVRRQGRMG